MLQKGLYKCVEFCPKYGMREEIEVIRQQVKNSRVSYVNMAVEANVNRHWLTKFGTDKVPGTSTKGLTYVERLKAWFEKRP